MTYALFSALAAALGVAIAAMIRYARAKQRTGLRASSVALALAVLGACWFLHDSGGIAAGVVFIVVLVGVQLLPNYPAEVRDNS